MDLAQFTADQIAQLKEMLGMGQTDASGRSIVRHDRQLHDLRLMPAKDDPRPLFIPSAEAPRDGRDLTKISEFPKLMFHKDTGDEITVRSSLEQRQHADLYDLVAPASRVMEPMEALQIELASFSDEDRKLILEAQKQTRMQALQEKLAGLSDDARDRLLAGAESEEKKAKSRKSA